MENEISVPKGKLVLYQGTTSNTNSAVFITSFGEIRLFPQAINMRGIGVGEAGILSQVHNRKKNCYIFTPVRFTV
jgi:hypothetical protein